MIYFSALFSSIHGTIIITLLLAILIVTNCLFLGCNKPSTNTIESDILTKTYVSQNYGYSLDYPANWDVFEWQNCTYFAPTGDFSMLIVVFASMHDKLNTETLSQLLWLDDLRTIDQSTNEILFTGIYGEIHVAGREIKKEMEDRQLIFTAICNEDLLLQNSSDMPYEIELSINSLRYMEPMSASIPPFTWEDPPLAVNIEEMISDYVNDGILEEKRAEKYENVRLLFDNVIITEVYGYLVTLAPGVFDIRSGSQDEDFYVISGCVKFRPRYSGALFNIQEGCRVTITGIIDGIESDYLVIKDCLFFFDNEQGAIY